MAGGRRCRAKRCLRAHQMAGNAPGRTSHPPISKTQAGRCLCLHLSISILCGHPRQRNTPACGSTISRGSVARLPAYPTAGSLRMSVTTRLDVYMPVHCRWRVGLDGCSALLVVTDSADVLFVPSGFGASARCAHTHAHARPGAEHSLRAGLSSIILPQTPTRAYTRFGGRARSSTTAGTRGYS